MAIQHVSLLPVVDLYQLRNASILENERGNFQKLIVEIGFGMGEVLISNAQQNPDHLFIGIEEHWERTYKTLSTIERIYSGTDKKNPNNIRIFKTDAWVAFNWFFEQQSIDDIYCLFPCPWPKKGHVKYRLFSTNFLQLLNSRLKPSGSVKIVTDADAYVDWIMEEIPRDVFDCKQTKIPPQFNTKFERKWTGEGRHEFTEIILTKTKHYQVEQLKEEILKSYKLPSFDPDRFRMDNTTGDISVIYKEHFFDPAQQKVFVHVIVSEEKLTQHFWVMIIKTEKFWRVCKLDGQQILSTAGIAKAIESVYQAAKNV